MVKKIQSDEEIEQMHIQICKKIEKKVEDIFQEYGLPLQGGYYSFSVLRKGSDYGSTVSNVMLPDNLNDKLNVLEQNMQTLLLINTDTAKDMKELLEDNLDLL